MHCPRLRKAAARRLAEAGCTEHEIAAITAHASLREIARYTKAADQQRLARAAMEKVSAKQEQKLSNFGDGLTVNGKNKWNQYNDLYLTIPPGLLRAGRRSRSVGAA